MNLLIGILDKETKRIRFVDPKIKISLGKNEVVIGTNRTIQRKYHFTLCYDCKKEGIFEYG